MAVTVSDLLNESQYQLVEIPNSGASYGSSLYTATEVAARLVYRTNMFNKLTGAIASYGSQTATSGSKVQDLSSISGNFTDILEVYYSADAGVTYTHIPRGSSTEVDDLVSDQSNVSIPSVWTYDTAKPQCIILAPAPTFTASNGKITLLYLPLLSAPTSYPDDFTPFIKYGLLADLFGKSGEAYDPFRASICESLFQLGIECTRGWLSGTP